MSNHAFNFEGGDILTKMGASWFVSYTYYLYVDKTMKKWEQVSTYCSRITRFNNSKSYHRFWLEQVLEMNDNNLNRNSLGLNAKDIKEMSKEILHTGTII